MEIGLIVKFGKAVPGREVQAIELWTEVKDFFEEYYGKGYFTFYEPFFYATGDLEAQAGFWILKGEREKIWKLVETEAYQWFMAKAQFLVEHLEVEWLAVGAEIDLFIERGAKVAAEFVPVR